MSDSDDESIGILNSDDIDIELIELPDIPDYNTFRNFNQLIYQSPPLSANLDNRIDSLLTDFSGLRTRFDQFIENQLANELGIHPLVEHEDGDKENKDNRPITELVFENADAIAPPVHREPEKTYYMDDDEEDALLSSEANSPGKEDEKGFLPPIPKQEEKFILPDILNAENDEPNYERSAKIAEFIDGFLYTTILGGFDKNKQIISPIKKDKKAVNFRKHKG